MKARRRFAQGTQVAAKQSRVDLDGLLEQHGATQRLVFTDAGCAIVQFRLASRIVRLQMATTPPAKAGRGRGRPNSPEQYEREAWRRLLLVTKAKLEIVAESAGDPEEFAARVEQEFLAFILLPDGATVHESFARVLAESYESGKMPMLPGKVG